MNPSVINIMVNEINRHLASSKTVTMGYSKYRDPVPHIKCRDGTRMSVQAGEYAYCTPRNNQGPWTHVEVMMITNTKPVHFDYPEDDVAAYIPIESVAQEILTRGNWIKEF